MSDGNGRYDVRADWPAVVPMGDTLAISAGPGCDDGWVEAFEVVLDEHERHAGDRSWSGIDFDHASGDDSRFVVFVRGIAPDARSHEVREAVDDLLSAANTVAQVGAHVYELARELRHAPATEPRGSVPPPTFDPLDDDFVWIRPRLRRYRR